MSEEVKPGIEASIEGIPIRLVSSFESSHTTGNPHLYPGERPETSYVTDGSNVYPIAVDWDANDRPHFKVKTEDGINDLDEVLLAQGVPTMDKRIPIVSYGANVCPSALRAKFEVMVEGVELDESGRPVLDSAGKPKPILDEHGNKTVHQARPDLMIIPTVYGTLSGFDVVHHDAPGQKANFFAELYAGPETVETEVSVAVSFLTQEQLLMLHATEPSYDLAGVGNVDIGNGHSLPAIFYAGKSSVLLKMSPDGALHPVALEAVPAQNRGLEAANSEAVLSQVLAIPEVASALADKIDSFTDEPVTAQTYTALALKSNLAGKKALQKIVGEELKRLGLQGEELITELPGMDFYSWSNPSLLPTLEQMLEGDRYSSEALILLPEQVLSRFPEPNRTVLLGKIRKHYRDSKG